MRNEKDLDIELVSGLDGADTSDADEPDDVDAVHARTPKPHVQGRTGRVREDPRRPR